jgi:hypothetical protein
VNKAAISGGNLVLKMVVLINGGAAVSLLRFIGSLSDKRAETAGALVWFAFGVASGAAGFLFAYFTNLFTGAAAGSFTKQWEHPYVVGNAISRRYDRVKLGFTCSQS